MKIYESAENYLEAILMLKEKNGSVRSIDIATTLGFSKPSVSVAMKQFRENGYITVQEGGLLELTASGLEIARSVYARHQVITRCLMLIGVPEETAREDACRIEHDISDETFERLQAVCRQAEAQP